MPLLKVNFNTFSSPRKKNTVPFCSLSLSAIEERGGPFFASFPFLFLSPLFSLLGRETERVKESNGRLQCAVDALPRECFGEGKFRRPHRAKERFRRPKKIREQAGHALTPVSLFSLVFPPPQIHQAYKNDAFLYNSHGMSGNVAQQVLNQQPMRDDTRASAFAGASPPPLPNNHHHASPKLWPSSQTAAVDAVAAAWAAAAARDRSSSRASSGGGGGGEFLISAQHSSSPLPPPHQLPQHHQLLSRDSSASFADPLTAFQQHQQLMNRPLLPPRRREG